MIRNRPFPLPRFVAICGNPKSGKSLVQEILRDSYDIEPVDDGFPLRKFGVDHLGLSWDQVQTQEGKKEFVEIAGKTWQVRDILGTLGKQLESMLGPDIMPYCAIQGVKNKPGSFSFGSVRRSQAAFYREHGSTLVLGINNPLAGPSPYDFDEFDTALVDMWIHNDAQERRLDDIAGRKDLEVKIASALSAWSAGQNAVAVL